MGRKPAAEHEEVDLSLAGIGRGINHQTWFGCKP